MDRVDLGSVSHFPASSLRSSPRVGDKRGCEGDLEESSDAPKRIKMRDLESVLLSEGNETSIACSNMGETEVHGHRNEEMGTYKVVDLATPMDSERQITKGNDDPDEDAICLTLCNIGGVQSSANLGSASARDKETNGPYLPSKVDKECLHNANASSGIVLDLNAADVSSTVDYNPFHPYKKLGQVRPLDASECGSTTGPVEESEPLRMWKEMKQNGFLSSSHGGIPIPKQQVRPAKKRKDDELKKKIETARREQANRFTKVAAPSGLLSKLNPGIINHVRNSKQVHSIIEAIVRSEKLDSQLQERFHDQQGKGSKENTDSMKVQHSAQDSSINQLSLGLNKPTVFSSSGCRNGICGSQYDDDTLALKLSSSVTMASEHASSTSNDDFSANQDNISSLSLKAANVASQWLELLEQDIKGRLSALRRSKKRVKNVIQTELPYLISTEFSPNQENNTCFGHSSEATSSKKAIFDMHVERWKSLFSQMDKALYEEGKHLENWLKQVQEMQAHCEKGLRYVGFDGFSRLGTSEDPRLKNKEALDRECAVRAAAASIYSTCNLIVTTENVQCF